MKYFLLTYLVCVLILALNLRQDKELAEFYRKLLIREASHYTMFLKFARKFGDRNGVDQKWQSFLEYEAEIMKGLGKKETVHG